MQGHGGAIDVQSAPGEGTRFRIVLPTSAGAARRARKRSGGPLVLLADADPQRRRSVAQALRADSLQVLEAGDAGQVLDLWSLHSQELDAAVVDAELSDPGGPSLAEALRADRPDLPVLTTPCAPGELRAQLGELIEKARARSVSRDPGP